MPEEIRFPFTREKRKRRPEHSSDPSTDAYAVPLTPDIFLITPSPASYACENALLIRDEVTVLVDTGLPYDQALELSQVVDLVVNTHAHLGHTGKNYLFSEVWAPKYEADIVEDFEKAVVFHGFVGQPFEGQWRALLAESGIGPMAKVSRRLTDGDVLHLGRTKWQIIHTPGHSPGHCVLYEPRLGVLYAADITLMSFGPWYATPSSDIPQFRESIETLLKLDLDVVATSVKGPIRDGIKERVRAFGDRFAQRDRVLMDLLRQPRTLENLAAQLPIYGSIGKRPDREVMIRFQERVMIEKHLVGLVQEGRISRDGEYFLATQ